MRCCPSIHSSAHEDYQAHRSHISTSHRHSSHHSSPPSSARRNIAAPVSLNPGHAKVHRCDPPRRYTRHLFLHPEHTIVADLVRRNGQSDQAATRLKKRQCKSIGRLSGFRWKLNVPGSNTHWPVSLTGDSLQRLPERYRQIIVFYSRVESVGSQIWQFRKE